METPEASDGFALSTGEEASLDALPDWSSLLEYYAATQRRDPRGRIAEFLDRHAAGWQLIRTGGHWWSGARLTITMESLPETFRESLMRRKLQSAAMGWPLSFFETAEGVAAMPGLILPVEWHIAGADLVLRLDGGRPTLNPSWLREVRRRTPWTEAGLIKRLFPEGEPDDLGAVSDRLRHALATLGGGLLKPGDLAGEAEITADRLQNAAALFLPEDGNFTKGAAEDLEALRDWSEEARRDTVLAALFTVAAPQPADSEVPVLSATPLTDRQMDAAEAALAGPLTVIQGPPGTGKSHVILTLILSAVLSGRSVLFASKNHQALDEVETRLRQIVPDAPLLTRGRDSDGQRNTSALQALREIVHGEARVMEDSDLEAERSAVLQTGAEQAALRRAVRQRTRLHLALSELVERRDAIWHHLSGSQSTGGRLSLLARLKVFLAHLLRRRPADSAAALTDDVPLAEIEGRVLEVRRLLTDPRVQPVQLDDDAPPDLGKTLLPLIPRWAGHVTAPDDPAWQHLSQRLQELDFAQIRSARRLNAEDARAVIALRPVWAISTLSVPSRMPLVPGLFDYVIFDEASQCDIASALPLFARARQAVVVGDPMQLRFVPSLGNAAEHSLMDAAGLPKTGRAAIAQSINSLFDFAERRPAARRLFLKDQFRSAPAIVGYLNEEFYTRQGLQGRCGDDSFRPPAGYKPGLAWEDVPGQVTREEGGNVNVAEAERITELLQQLADQRGFEGSVGVLSPFNAQIERIERTVRAKLSEGDRERLKLRVATIDRFQGGEADVILFSLVLAPNAPHLAKTFLKQERRRLNVAVSRAHAVCLVVGHLAYAKGCGVRHIQRLAHRATTPWSPPRPPFDSDWERRMDTAMRRRGLEPIPQYPVGTHYLDFALDPEGCKLDIEVDGRRWHTDPDGNRKSADRMRDIELRVRGWKVLRFWVHELSDNMEGCLDRIERELGRR